MKLIIGLGNPGDMYSSTRHNIGWKVIDAFAHSLDSDCIWNRELKFEAEISRVSTPDIELILAKPLTYMNLSGRSVSKLVNFYKVDPAADLLIIHDDKDLLFGNLKLESDRSSAGQRGVQNIIDMLGTKSFARLRIGVGHEKQQLPTDAFVLQPFTVDEKLLLPNLLEKAEGLLLEHL